MVGINLERVRSELPILENWTYLNTGTVGVMPDPVFEALTARLRDYEQLGHVGQAAAVDGADIAKSRLATLLGVSAAEIALNRNATDGINLAASTFPLEPGDEVITSTEEHPALVLPWLHACERAGASLRFMPVRSRPDEFADALNAILTPRTRVIALSHVSCETGTRLPVEDIRSVVGPDPFVFVDASQSLGQFRFTIPDLSADMVIGNGHKWLAGPKGTGFAWVSRAAEDLVTPSHVASDSFDPHWSRHHYQTDPAPSLKFANGAKRFEFGTRAWHLHAGLVDAIDYQDAIGWDNIESHISRTSSVLKHALTDIDGVTIHSPMSSEESSGLVTFSIDGWHGEQLSKTLWEQHNIVQRRVEVPSSVRVSCAYFTNDDDVDHLVEVVKSITSRS